MKKVKTYHVETTDARFMIDIYEKPSGDYKADYYGQTPKFAQVMQPGMPIPVAQDVPGGRVNGASIDEAFNKACEEIALRYETIERVLP